MIFFIGWADVIQNEFIWELRIETMVGEKMLYNIEMNLCARRETKSGCVGNWRKTIYDSQKFIVTNIKIRINCIVS